MLVHLVVCASLGPRQARRALSVTFGIYIALVVRIGELSSSLGRLTGALLKGNMRQTWSMVLTVATRHSSLRYRVALPRSVVFARPIISRRGSIQIFKDCASARLRR